MSNENGSAPELSKVVSTIMEHPELIEQITRLVKEEPAPTSDITDAADNGEPQPTEEPVSAEHASAEISDSGKRARLLYALKPYLSERRAKAIDSMLTFGEIFDMMKSKKQR